MMNAYRPWLSWVAIGVGALALLVALFGSGLRPLLSLPGDSRPTVAQQAPIGAAPQANHSQQPGQEARGGGRLRPGQAGQARPGGFLRPLFKVVGGLRQITLVVVLALLGFWLIRGRSSGGRGGRRTDSPAGSQTSTDQPYQGETQI